MNKITKRTILSENNCIIWTRSDEQIEYSAAIEYMEKRVADIIARKDDNMIWFLEHPQVYTVGASSNLADLLDKNKFPVHKTSRGGQITYHGPGQRVIYIMLDLKKIFYPKEADLAKYVRLLEQTVIDFLLSLGISAERLEGRAGVWVKAKNGSFNKIAAIGIRVKKWVCFHGISVNISPNLDDFKGIIPCGIQEYGVTSLERLGYNLSVEEFDIRFSKILEDHLKNASIV
jgi:lipoyl(octanoyl) transferase